MFFTALRFVSLFSVLLSRFFSALWLAVLLCAHLFVALASSPLASSSVLENHKTKEKTGTLQLNNRLVPPEHLAPTSMIISSVTCVRAVGGEPTLQLLDLLGRTRA